MPHTATGTCLRVALRYREFSPDQGEGTEPDPDERSFCTPQCTSPTPSWLAKAHPINRFSKRHSIFAIDREHGVDVHVSDEDEWLDETFDAELSDVVAVVDDACPLREVRRMRLLRHH